MSRYLRCDRCGADYDGKRVPGNNRAEQGPYHFSMQQHLMKDALEAGWLVDRDKNFDLCPACVKELGIVLCAKEQR